VWTCWPCFASLPHRARRAGASGKKNSEREAERFDDANVHGSHFSTSGGKAFLEPPRLMQLRVELTRYAVCMPWQSSLVPPAELLLDGDQGTVIEDESNRHVSLSS
jgi:hypothetical protein